MAEKNDGLKSEALEVKQQFLRGNQPDSLGINTSEPRFPQYAVVSKRADSYKNWPSYIPLKPDVMIDAGLVYTGVADSVRCYHCGGGLRNWEEGDDPWEAHAKWYPKCLHVVLFKGQKYIDCVARGEKPPEEDCTVFSKRSEQKLLQTVASQSCKDHDYSKEKIRQAIRLFLLYHKGSTDFTAADILTHIFQIEEEEENGGAAVSNVGSVHDCCKGAECKDHEKPRFPQYAVVSQRADSYKNWPSNIPSDVMIDAGLVYTGVADSVRCYHCGGGFRNWGMGNDPWEQHAKWYPNCSHVVLVKGQNYINCVARGEKPPEEDCTVFSTKLEQNKVSDYEFLQTVAAQSCKEYDYSEEKILQAIRLFQWNNKGSTEFKAPDILRNIFQIEEGEEKWGAAVSNVESVHDCC